MVPTIVGVLFSIVVYMYSCNAFNFPPLDSRMGIPLSDHLQDGKGMLWLEGTLAMKEDFGLDDEQKLRLIMSKAGDHIDEGERAKVKLGVEKLKEIDEL